MCAWQWMGVETFFKDTFISLKIFAKYIPLGWACIKCVLDNGWDWRSSASVAWNCPKCPLWLHYILLLIQPALKATSLNFAALYKYYKEYIGLKRLPWPAFYSALCEGQVGRGQIGRPVAKIFRIGNISNLMAWALRTYKYLKEFPCVR